MEKDTYSQLDLFSASKGSLYAAGHHDQGNRSRFKGYERSVLIICACIITGIIAFSLGVEKGRRNAKVVTPVLKPAPEPAAKKPAIKSATKAEPVATIILKDETAAYKEFKQSLQKYTIQVASFTAKTYAQQAQAALQKKCPSAIIKPSGKYIALCVGNFDNKETARSTLAQLKKQYSSCYIRRL